MFSSLHNIAVETQMDYFDFSGPWWFNLLDTQWDSHKPPGIHPKYHKLFSEDKQRFFTGLERHGVSD